MKQLATRLGLVFMTAAASGCATVCDQRCWLEKSAQAMTASPDVGLRASAAKTLADLHPEIAKGNKESAQLGVPQDMVCTVTSTKAEGGGVSFVMSNCHPKKTP